MMKILKRQCLQTMQLLSWIVQNIFRNIDRGIRKFRQHFRIRAEKVSVIENRILLITLRNKKFACSSNKAKALGIIFKN